MASYKVVGGEAPVIVRNYDLAGKSWRDAKKEARQWFLSRAKALRAMKKKDVVLEKRENTNDAVPQ